MSRTKMWKVLLLMALIAALGTWLPACGGGSSESASDGSAETEKAPAKEARNGFDRESNQELTIGGVTYSVPEYFELDEDSSKENNQYYYAEAGDSVVMLYLTEPELEYNSPKDYEDYIEGFAKSLEDGAIDNTDTELEINGMPAACYTFQATFDGAKTSGKGYLLHNKDVDTISVLMLGQSDNSEYDYTDDFDRIAKSAKPQKKPKVSKDFKKTMDGYEEFFDEYVEFMKNYQDSDDVMGMLSDYTDYMNKYQEVMSDLEAIDQDELSEADLAYYIKVNARIQKKLLEVSGQ